MKIFLFLILSLIPISASALDVNLYKQVNTNKSIRHILFDASMYGVLSQKNPQNLSQIISAIEGLKIQNPKLYNNGVRSKYPLETRMLYSLWSLCGFITDCKFTKNNNIELTYSFHYQEYLIHRRVFIKNGYIFSRADIYGNIGYQGRVKHAYIHMTAKEGTTIQVQVGCSVNSGLNPNKTNSKCRLINRLVERRASTEMSKILNKVVNTGVYISKTGHVEFQSTIHNFIESVVNARR